MSEDSRNPRIMLAQSAGIPVGVAQNWLWCIEQAGLLVLDPKDDALVERIEDAYGKHGQRYDNPLICLCGDPMPLGEGQHVARAVLAALENPDDGSADG